MSWSEPVIGPDVIWPADPREPLRAWCRIHQRYESLPEHKSAMRQARGAS